MRKLRFHDWALAVSFAFPLIAQSQTATKNPPIFSGGKSDSSPIELVSLKTVNSTALDFCAVPFHDGIVFTTNRRRSTGNAFDDNQNIWCTDLLFAEKLGFGFYGEPKPLPGKINGKFYEGTVSVSPDGSEMAFSRNSSKKKSKRGVMKMQLFQAEITDGSWREVKEMPLNLADFNSCHPAYSADGLWLVFASDRPGGLGGMDLWATARGANGDTWAEPMNLGPEINTEKDEIFPFLADDETLYFSSESHGSMGKLDVFSAKPLVAGNLLAWQKPESIGEPFNSAADDFGFCTAPGGKEGYLSSNRNPLTGDDIYEWRRKAEQPKNTQPLLSGAVINKKLRTAVPNAEIALTNRCGGEVSTFQTESDGSFHFPLNCNCDYEMTVVKNQFLTEKLVIITVGKCDGSQPENLLVELVSETPPPSPTLPQVVEKQEVAKPLPPAKPVIVNEIQAENMKVETGMIIRLNKVYYDLGKASIRPDAAAELDKLVALMKQNPGMNIELSSHTDSRGSTESNLALSQRRAETAARYVLERGIEPVRITFVGKGEYELVNPCADGVKCAEEEHQANRRTEVKVVNLVGERVGSKG